MKIQKILCVRLDKIGDLVSTLPVDAALIKQFPTADIQWVIHQGLGFLGDCAVPPRKYSEISTSPQGRRQFREILEKQKPYMVVVYYAPWWVSFECLRAGIALRVGRRSQWFSFLFYTHGLRQSRSQSEHHEAEYNWQLTQYAAKNLNHSLGLGDHSASEASLVPALQLKAPLLRQLFEKFHLRRGDYLVVHPGMAGSALNWPTNSYVELIRLIFDRDSTVKVLITGTKLDAAWTGPVLAAFKDHARLINAVDALNLRELLFVLENARAVIAPSTGVAHLAASLGTPTRAIYSPLRAHSSKRWGPRGQDVKIFEPTTSSNLQDPMLTISAAEVFASLPPGHNL